MAQLEENKSPLENNPKFLEQRYIMCEGRLPTWSTLNALGRAHGSDQMTRARRVKQKRRQKGLEAIHSDDAMLEQTHCLEMIDKPVENDILNFRVVLKRKEKTPHYFYVQSWISRSW